MSPWLAFCLGGFVAIGVLGYWLWMDGFKCGRNWDRLMEEMVNEAIEESEREP
jgi:hypothetical protein